jgi:hemerythrin-like domain-containing protein
METINATQLLRNDHKIVKGLFRQVEGIDARAPSMKAGVLREIYMLLEIHSRLEEEIFYPAMQDVPETSLLIGESVDDHRAVVQMIRELKERDPSEEGFNNPLAELIAAVETHVATEESKLFKAAERVLGKKLEEMGKQMFRMRQELMKAPEYRDAQPAQVQNPRGGEQMRKTGTA